MNHHWYQNYHRHRLRLEMFLHLKIYRSFGSMMRWKLPLFYRSVTRQTDRPTDLPSDRVDPRVPSGTKNQKTSIFKHVFASCLLSAKCSKEYWSDSYNIHPCWAMIKIEIMLPTIWQWTLNIFMLPFWNLFFLKSFFVIFFSK